MKFKDRRHCNTVTITDADSHVCGVSGDENPFTSTRSLRNTRFGRRIAHGMLTASLISAVLANDLPGQGSIYLGQTLQFVAPVFLTTKSPRASR